MYYNLVEIFLFYEFKSANRFFFFFCEKTKFKWSKAGLNSEFSKLVLVKLKNRISPTQLRGGQKERHIDFICLSKTYEYEAQYK